MDDHPSETPRLRSLIRQLLAAVDRSVAATQEVARLRAALRREATRPELRLVEEGGCNHAS
jgi:hypothetical protein